MIQAIIIFGIWVFLLAVAVSIFQTKVDKLWYFLKHHNGEIGKEFRDYIKEVKCNN